MSEEQDLYSDKNTKWRLRGTNVFVFYSPKQLASFWTFFSHCGQI